MSPLRSIPDRTVNTPRGIALPVILLFLLVITITASFGIRRATLAEGMTRNQLDYEVSRQSAEAALRDAERDLLLVMPTGSMPTGATCARNEDRPIQAKTGLPFFGETCPRGQCRFHTAYYDTSNFTTLVNAQPWWPTAKDGLWGDNIPLTNCTFTGAVPIGTFTGTPQVRGVARQPEYLIEYMARGDDIVMRITARGFGADIRTETVLQSYFRPFQP